MRGGYVHTPADPHATALCLEDGQVTWTGDDDAAWQFVDGADQVIELQGRLVTPAFVDAHAHLAQTGLSALGVDLADAASAAETLDLIALYARSCTLPVILGHGWDESTWPDAAGFDGDALARVTGASLLTSPGSTCTRPSSPDSPAGTGGWSATITMPYAQP